MADERTAEQRAFDKGTEMAELKAAIREVRAHQEAQNGALDRAATALEKVESCQEEILGRLDKRDTIDEERTRVAAARAEKLVTTRSFVIGVIGLALVIVGLYLGAA